MDMLTSYIIFALQLGFVISLVPAAAQETKGTSLPLQTFVTVVKSPLSLRSLLTVLPQGISDCGKATGAVTLVTQSDIDSISNCTTIFGILYISLQSSAFESPSYHLSPASPEVFTLPSNLQSIEGALLITVEDTEAATTTFVAPNLQRVGYGNDSDGAMTIRGPRLDTWNLTNTSFPALTDVGGSFTYQTGPFVTAVTGFPVLATIGDVQGAGDFYVNGSFASVEFPALNSVVKGEVMIETTDPSFKCPSNITPKIVTYPNCIVCQYFGPKSEVSLDCPANSEDSPTPSITSTAGTTAPTATRKTSGASALNHAGNRSYQIGLISKDLQSM
jgi:hypothetical protein